MIPLRLDTRSGVPPFRQITQQVRHAIATGVLEPGDQLPTVRAVVDRLVVNPNTVFKAYRELEHEGLVKGRPGAGTFVLRRPPGPPPGTRLMLASSLDRWLEQARRAGLDDASIEALVDERLYSTSTEVSA